jgi:hypothetical protein
MKVGLNKGKKLAKKEIKVYKYCRKSKFTDER